MSSSDWWRKGFEANVTVIESLIKEELDINASNYVDGLQLFISLITFLKSKSRNNNLSNNKSLILPTEAIKVNKSAKKEDNASEVPHGTSTTWNAGFSTTTNSSFLNNVKSETSYSSTKPNIDEEGRKKVNFPGLSKKRAHKEVSIPLDFENQLFSVTNPIVDHVLLATPTNLVNEPEKKKKDEANEAAKRKKDEATELAKKKKEEAIELAKKKKEEAIELAKKKKEEAIELAKKKKEEAIELLKKKKEEAIEHAKKKAEAIELAKKKKEEANELAKKKKEEANELAKKKKEEAIELAKKKKEEAIELAKKRKEEATELAKKKKEAANELARKQKEEAIELAKKKKGEESASSTKPKFNKEGRKLDNLVRPLSKKRAHKEFGTPTNLDSLTNDAQFNNVPGMSGLASPYYSNVGNITSSLAVKGVADVVDDSTTKCPKDISGKSSESVTHGDTTSLYRGILRKINSRFDYYADLEPTALSNYIDIDEEEAHPLSSNQPLLEISSSPWNDEKILSLSSSTNITDPKNLGSKASLHEVIPYVSFDEPDSYEDSKTLNFSRQHLIQWSDDKINSGAFKLWTGQHDKSFNDEPVWDLVEEEPIPVASQVYTGDDMEYIKDGHVRDLVGEEPMRVPLQVYTGDATKSIKDEHVWDLVKEEPKHGALQIYTGDETKSFKDDHVWDLVEDEPNSDCLNSAHDPRKRAKRSAS